MNGRGTLTSVGIAIVVLALLAGLAAAQGPEAPEGELSSEGADGVAAAVADGIPIQGRLTNAAGNPLAGTFSIRFRLYADDLGTTVVCEDTHSVTVENGLFFSVIWGTCWRRGMDGARFTWVFEPAPTRKCGRFKRFTRFLCVQFEARCEYHRYGWPWCDCVHRKLGS